MATTSINGQPEMWLTQAQYDVLDKSTVPVGTKIYIVGSKIEESDLSQEVQNKLNSGGGSSLFPEVNIPYSPSVEIAANNKSIIAQLTGNITLTLGAGVENMDNEWAFVITQGNTAYTVTLPTVNWVLGAAPLFDKNSTTYVMLYYVGDTLCGEWRSV